MKKISQDCDLLCLNAGPWPP